MVQSTSGKFHSIERILRHTVLLHRKTKTMKCKQRQQLYSHDVKQDIYIFNNNCLLQEFYSTQSKSKAHSNDKVGETGINEI